MTTAACACGVEVTAPTDDAFPDAYLVHVRAAHQDWPFADLAVQVVGEALLRLTGAADRRDALGAVTIAPVDGTTLTDWLAFMDHDAFVDKPWVAACYCLEQHGAMAEPGLGAWRQNRQAMIDRFRAGTAFGYLASVDGQPAGWVNAALRRDQVYALGREDDVTTATVSCFNIAPPYRGHRLAGQLLDRVLADAPVRGVTRVEAYPRKAEVAGDGYSGSRALFEGRGFSVVKELPMSHVVRLEL